MRFFNTPEAKVEREQRETAHQERLQERFEEGDPSLRRTVFGNIKQRRTGGILVESAEGIRFAYASTPLPQAIGEAATNEIEITLTQPDSFANEPSEERPQVNGA